MNEQHRKLALDMAMEGRDVDYITQKLATGHGLSASAARQCATYAVTGNALPMGLADATKVKSYNNRRARKAASVLIQFYDKDDLPTSACDLLADLMHLAARSRTGFNFEDKLESAIQHFQAERIGGQS